MILLFVGVLMGGPSTDENHIAVKQVEVMTASHYGGPGDNFHGRRMASGEVFDAHNPTLAAHKSLPFGTKIRLVNPETGQEQVVMVKDRGPFVRHRDLDVSFAAAQKLGFAQKGIARLEAEILP